MASISISCSSCSATEGVMRNGKSTAGHQRYLCSHCRNTWQLQFTYTASHPGTHQKIIDMAMNGVGCRATARIMGIGLNTILRHLKNSGRSQQPRAYNRAGTSLSALKWTNSGATSVLNHASAGYFTRMTEYRGRSWHTSSVDALTMAMLERLLSLLSPFDVVVWMTDGWPLYESRLKGKLHVISKRYTQRIERHNLNLREHLARLGQKSLSFSKSVELHDKVIGHYLNITYYQ